MKEHDYSIDIARGIACLLVIIGHISSTPSQVNVWIYAFHMPLFFIISGLIINTKVKCTLCQGHYDFFLFRFLLYICLLCRGIKVMPLIDCFHLLL